jgi:sulfate/thiosulfate transport system permease protein
MTGRLVLRSVALGYLALLILLPLGLVLWRVFEHGIAPVWQALTQPAALHAVWLTTLATAIAVLANTVFGVICGLLLVRHPVRGRSLLAAGVGLPLAVSPVVVGLALIVVYGRNGWIGSWLVTHGLPVIFASPGIILATVFISLPFVVREIVPVLQELGVEQEQAALTLGASPLQTFCCITLPAIRPAIAYGVVLTTARALGEFGAVSVVSGNLAGQTQTLTLYVQDRFQAFDLTGAYTASVELALLAVVTLLLLNRTKHRADNEGRTIDGNHDSPRFEAIRQLCGTGRRLGGGAGRRAHGAARSEREREIDAAAGDRRA